MSVALIDLRRITSKLYDHLEARGVREVDLPSDSYWFIPREQRVETTRQPDHFMVRQFSDDLKDLVRIGDGSSPPVAYALVWLASILLELGETTLG